MIPSGSLASRPRKGRDIVVAILCSENTVAACRWHGNEGLSPPAGDDTESDELPERA